MSQEQPLTKAQALSLCAQYLGGAWAAHVDSVRGGLSNYLFVASLADSVQPQAGQPNRVLIRVFGEILSNNAESVVLDSVIFALLSEKRMGPHLYGVFKGGRIEEFVANSAPLRCTAWEMPLSKEPRFVFKMMQSWLRSVEEVVSGKTDREEPPPRPGFNATPVARFLRDFRRRLLQSAEFAVVFCHNDLQENNILKFDNASRQHGFSLQLIDFEYCSYNWRAFDIGNFFNEWTLDYTPSEWPYFSLSPRLLPQPGGPADLLALLPALVQRARDRPQGAPVSPRRESSDCRDVAGADTVADDVEVATAPETNNAVAGSEADAALLLEAKYGALMSHFFWSVWSLLQASVSSIHFDFKEYAQLRFRLYAKLKEEITGKPSGLPVQRLSTPDSLSPPCHPLAVESLAADGDRRHPPADSEFAESAIDDGVEEVGPAAAKVAAARDSSSRESASLSRLRRLVRGRATSRCSVQCRSSIRSMSSGDAVSTETPFTSTRRSPLRKPLSAPPAAPSSATLSMAVRRRRRSSRRGLARKTPPKPPLSPLTMPIAGLRPTGPEMASAASEARWQAQLSGVAVNAPAVSERAPVQPAADKSADGQQLHQRRSPPAAIGGFELLLDQSRLALKVALSAGQLALGGELGAGPARHQIVWSGGGWRRAAPVADVGVVGVNGVVGVVGTLFVGVLSLCAERPHFARCGRCARCCARSMNPRSSDDGTKSPPMLWTCRRPPQPRRCVWPGQLRHNELIAAPRAPTLALRCPQVAEGGAQHRVFASTTRSRFSPNRCRLLCVAGRAGRWQLPPPPARSGGSAARARTARGSPPAGAADRGNCRAGAPASRYRLPRLFVPVASVTAVLPGLLDDQRTVIRVQLAQLAALCVPLRQDELRRLTGRLGAVGGQQQLQHLASGCPPGHEQRLAVAARHQAGGVVDFHQAAGAHVHHQEARLAAIAAFLKQLWEQLGIIREAAAAAASGIQSEVVQAGVPGGHPVPGQHQPGQIPGSHARLDREFLRLGGAAGKAGLDSNPRRRRLFRCWHCRGVQREPEPFLANADSILTKMRCFVQHSAACRFSSSKASSTAASNSCECGIGLEVAEAGPSLSAHTASPRLSGSISEASRRGLLRSISKGTASWKARLTGIVSTHFTTRLTMMRLVKISSQAQRSAIARYLGALSSRSAKAGLFSGSSIASSDTLATMMLRWPMERFRRFQISFISFGSARFFVVSELPSSPIRVLSMCRLALRAPGEFKFGANNQTDLGRSQLRGRLSEVGAGELGAERRCGGVCARLLSLLDFLSGGVRLRRPGRPATELVVRAQWRILLLGTLASSWRCGDKLSRGRQAEFASEFEVCIEPVRLLPRRGRTESVRRSRQNRRRVLTCSSRDFKSKPLDVLELDNGAPWCSGFVLHKTKGSQSQLKASCGDSAVPCELGTPEPSPAQSCRMLVPAVVAEAAVAASASTAAAAAAAQSAGWVCIALWPNISERIVSSRWFTDSRTVTITKHRELPVKCGCSRRHDNHVTSGADPIEPGGRVDSGPFAARDAPVNVGFGRHRDLREALDCSRAADVSHEFQPLRSGAASVGCSRRSKEIANVFVVDLNRAHCEAELPAGAAAASPQHGGDGQTVDARVQLIANHGTLWPLQQEPTSSVMAPNTQALELSGPNTRSLALAPGTPRVRKRILHLPATFNRPALSSGRMRTKMRSLPRRSSGIARPPAAPSIPHEATELGVDNRHRC
uniref:Choline kinase n=1 Tax=Macrostomum lignano TaxID=282301 RepID=A0A1I8I855_9PLAT